MNKTGLLQSAAIVCSEVAGGAPILRAERSEPQDEADSGWQFLCGALVEDWQAAKVWAVHEVLEQEPSLTNYIELPVGTVVIRGSLREKWKISQANG